jgi:polyisoprenoid-binding protein YceI
MRPTNRNSFAGFNLKHYLSTESERTITMTTATVPQSGTSTWTVDASHTEAEFAVKHLMISTVKGRIPSVEGSLTIDEDNLRDSTVAVRFDVASIDTRTAMRDDHLRSADFFDVARFPVLAFTSTSVDADSLEPGATFTVRGQLTIRDVTKDVTLDVTVGGRTRDPYGNERIGFLAETRIDRREFGLNYNAALETGGVVVGHEVRIAIDLQAIRTA